MEAAQDTTSLQTAIRWLLQTILPSLLVGGKLDVWIRQAGLGSEVEGLRDEIEQVDGVVSAVNSRSEIRNRSLARSLAALKELLYDAGDLVDELDCYRLQRQLHGGPWHWHHPNETDGQSSSSTGDSIQNASADDSSRRKRRRGDDSTDQITAANTGPWNKDQISKRIQDITGQLQDIRGNVRRVLKMLGPGSRAGQNRCRGTATLDPRRSTSSLVQGKVYGRAEEKSHVIELIKERKSDAGVTVLPIVGIAGVGKTTLAQLVYNDPDLESQFDLWIWIWVSNSFDETRVTREMLDFVSHGTLEGQCKLQEVLKGHVKSKRVLLILDDIWDDVTDCQWNQLLAPFKSDDAKGNMILLTIRKPSLAKKRGTTRPVNLHGLKNGDFWLMFKACAFGDENYEEQVSLGELGQQIAKRLQGNPLAAETAGTLLREHITVDHWNNILKNEDWKSLQLSSGIMSALKLCYDQLPYSLQQCFSYCSIFPYGYHFLAEELVRMWISQGFVKCNHSSMILEEGRYYLCDLVNLGFFEQVEGKELPSGRTQNYAMCGLMHDLARVVSNTECGAMDGLRYNEMLPTIHHLSIVTDGQTGNIPGSEKFERKLQSIFTSVPKLRTFVLTGQYESSFFEEVFQKAYSLRVLQISATSADFHSFRYTLVNLIHLRYLNLDGHVEQGSCSPQVHLYDDSDVQGNAALPALQKVHLENCGEKQAILSLEKLPFLTTLKLTNMWGVRELLVPLLEELVLVNMPGLERCSCTSLGDLVSSLRVLEIRKCSALKVFDLFEKAPETRLKPLDSLQLHSCTSLEDLRIEDCRWITAVEGLDLVKLKHLNVWKNSRLRGISGKGYCLQSQLDGLIINDLCVLTTSICKGLTCLQHLTIQSLECEAKRLTDDQERALLLHKSLQDLLFDGCEYLVHLPAGLHSLPALKKLTIISCNRILRLPKEEVPRSLEELVIEDCSVELSEQCRLLETSKLKVTIYEDCD